ncbi:MAG: hypothetical protein JOS17DRAFT_744027 [Linnemannia elongata]|nr:MAG: hypothetical protein JOS17DRAFT_744027 [Linnemannia elongata]
MPSHHTTSSSSSKPVLTLRISSILATVVLLLLITISLTPPVSAKGGHFPAAVTDNSGPCIKRCSDIYENEMNTCASRVTNPTADSNTLNNCRLDVANLFQDCAKTCVTPGGTSPVNQ